MPELSRFLGIVIGIFPREHAPPHFHAVYGEYQITVDVKTGIVHGYGASGKRLVLDGVLSGVPVTRSASPAWSTILHS